MRLGAAGGPGGRSPCALALQWCQLSADHSRVFPQVCEQSEPHCPDQKELLWTQTYAKVLVHWWRMQGLNDTFRQMYKRPGQDIRQGLETWQLVAAGGSAGAVQGTLTYPLDLIKTRLALAKDSAHASPVHLLRVRTGGWCRCAAIHLT